MKSAELRRHSVRDKPAEELSPSGRRLAQEVGAGVGPFALSIASPVRRARETSEAMGFPPHRLDPMWGEISDAVVAEIGWPAPFARVGAAVRQGGPASRKAAALYRSLAQYLGEVGEGQAVLVLTHGGFPELIAAHLFPVRELEPWGGVLRCMEGIRIRFENGAPSGAEVLRVEGARTRI